MANEYIEEVEELIERYKGVLAKHRSQGNLLNEGRLCGMIARRYSELVGTGPLEDKYRMASFKLARVFFRAQREIANSLDNSMLMNEACEGLGALYENTGLLQKAFDVYSECGRNVRMAAVKIIMNAPLNVKNEVLKEADGLLKSADESSEVWLLRARIAHHRALDNLQWGVSRDFLQLADSAAKTWLEGCHVRSAHRMIAEQRCLSAASLPYEARRQAFIDAWNDALPWFDQQLMQAKSTYTAIREAMRSQQIANGVKLASLPQAIEQIIDAYQNLAHAQLAIGDCELAEATLALCLDFCQRHSANTALVPRLKEKIQEVRVKADAERLVNQSNGLHVPIDEWVAALEILGMWEDAVDAITFKLPVWESSGSYRLVWAHSTLIRLLSLMKRPSIDHLRRLAALKPSARFELAIVEKKWKEAETLARTPEQRLELLSAKASDEPFLMQECMSLFTAIQTDKEDQLDASLDSEEGVSYFVDRKPTRTLQSLLDKDMVMRSRKRTGQTLNLRVKRQVNKNGPKAAIAAKSHVKASKTPIIIEDDISDFIEEDTASSTSSVSDLDGAVDRGDDDSMFDTGTTAPILQAYIPKHIRVTVQIGTFDFLIPCTDDDISQRRTIGWLIDEATRRCTATHNQTPQISGMMHGGGTLFPSDPVTEVLSDGARVLCNVLGWSRRAPHDVFAEFLSKSDNPCFKPVIGRLASARDGHYDLSSFDLPFQWDVWSALLNAIAGDARHLDLSQNCLDDRFPPLLSLSKMEKLRFVDLSGNLLRGQTLAEVRMAHHLTLDLRFNPLDSVPSTLPGYVDFLFTDVVRTFIS